MRAGEKPHPPSLLQPAYHVHGVYRHRLGWRWSGIIRHRQTNCLCVFFLFCVFVVVSTMDTSKVKTATSAIQDGLKCHSRRPQAPFKRSL